MAIDDEVDERVPRGVWRDTRLWRYVAVLVVKILYVRDSVFVISEFFSNFNFNLILCVI